jgi:hypothetical protein
MNIHLLYAWGALALLAASLLAGITVAHYALWRFRVRRRGQDNRYRSKVYPYCLALGMAFLQLVRVFYQPDAAYLLEVKQDEDADEDDSSDPETPAGRLRHFHRQLRRIRRGEPIDRLEFKM